jgi:hypothetical protein
MAKLAVPERLSPWFAKGGAMVVLLAKSVAIENVGSHETA